MKMELDFFSTKQVKKRYKKTDCIITQSVQTVDKVGVGDYSQHQLFVNSHCFNKN